MKEEYPPHVAAAIAQAERREARGRAIVIPAHNGKPEFTYTGLPSPRAKGRISPSPYRSQLELEYSQHLDAARLDGEILEYWYEPWTFHLGGEAGTKGGVKWRIDWLVMLPDSMLEIRETKGFFRRGERERLKLAAAKFPFTVKAITRNAAGGWEEELF